MKTICHSFIFFVFLIFILTGCQKEYSFDDVAPGTSSGSAVISFVDSSGNCSAPVIVGTFQAGNALDGSNKITIQVNVTDTGSYALSSNSLNGIQFSASGGFTLKGTQTIILTGTGTPVAGGSFNYTFGNSRCGFSVTCSGNAAPPSGGTGCKACVYVPLCVGSKYSYYDTVYGVASIKNGDLLSSVDTLINSKIYQKIAVSSGTGYYNCTNGETNTIAYGATSLGGITLQKIQMTMIKANATVGTTWSDDVINQLGQTVVQKFTIEAKGVSKMVGTFNFTDIIVVRLETGIDLPPFGYIGSALSKYYYAKGVGLVEVTTADPNSGLEIFHSVIKSYSIP
ncbi:MAG: hypothetical protein JWP81_1182 [Ferruginibacter sp.]|nr:hypothetical protein [Ferruginibacter sp.]